MSRMPRSLFPPIEHMAEFGWGSRCSFPQPNIFSYTLVVEWQLDAAMQFFQVATQVFAAVMP